VSSLAAELVAQASSKSSAGFGAACKYALVSIMSAQALLIVMIAAHAAISGGLAFPDVSIPSNGC
jgi:hypothetical protein